MNMTEVCVKKPVFAWMIMAAAVLFGVLSFGRVGVSQFPDVDFPSINVRVSWEGAAPDIIETDVVEPLEEALVQVEGVRSLTSTSQQGSARITLEMDISRDVDTAMQDVQTRISQTQRRLPPDIDPPIISKSNPEDQPIMWIALSGAYPQRVLSDYARYQVRERLQTVSGVGEIIMGGQLDRNIRIWLDAGKLDERRLTVTDINRALRQQHVELPAGRIETADREVNVRVLGEAIDLDTFRNLVVGRTAGNPIYLQDVALIEDGFEDARRMARVQGVPAQGIGVKKQRGANSVAVAQEIRAMVGGIAETLPEGMDIGINFDSTQFIEESISEIQFELFLSVLLTALICWLFLGSFSSTINVLLAIPMSLLGTVAVIYFLGFTLNTFTLLGLALAVGLVVDDAIMVLENVYRHAEMGKDKVTAALDGAAQIKFPAMAATIAVMAVFLPVVFMEGAVGRFFLQFGITLVVAISLSYVEAFTLAPSRLAQFLQPATERKTWFGRGVENNVQRLERAYKTTLHIALRRPALVLLGGVVVFTGALFMMQRMPAEFVPSQDQSRLMVRMQTAVGSSLGETDAILQQAETFLNEHPYVERSMFIVGGFGGAGVNAGISFVTLVPPDKRSQSHLEFAGELRQELNSYPGLRAMVQDPSQSGFAAGRGFPVQFTVRGPDWDQLIALSQDLQEKLDATGTVVDLDSDYQLGMPEVRITPNRAVAADLGIPVEDVATTLSALVGGSRVGKYSADGRRLDVRMRLLADQRSRPEDISRLHVKAPSGELVPLSSLVSFAEVPALQAITREDRERAITLQANVAPGHSQDEALAAVEGLQADVPVGYSVVLSGASVAFQESMSTLFFALFLGVAFAYMVLASQFNSFLHPVTVLTILPLSVAGAVFMLWVTNNTLNIFSMIGLLLLLGIVMKNSIILVDYANQARERGENARDAMLYAGPVRLRPILMTSMATLMAAVPPALGLGPGSETRAPMALGIIGGIAVSTMLSLVVVPSFYVVADGVLQKVKGKLFGKNGVSVTFHEK